MADVATELKNLTLLQAQEYLTQANIPYSLQGAYLSEYLAGISGKGTRTFNYSQPFPAAKPECAPTFTPKFSHVNWTDGESVVQASETPTEAGFNLRFNNLRTDLDAIKIDLVHAYACMAEMRQSLSKLLDEIRGELNRLNAAIADQDKGTPVGPLEIDPKYLTPKKYLGEVIKDDIRYAVYEQGDIFEYRKLLADLPVELPRLLDPTRIPPQARIPGEIEEITQNPRLNLIYEQPFTVVDFARDFGNIQLDAGGTVADAVRVLPSDKQYDTVEQLVADLKVANLTLLRADTTIDSNVNLASLETVQATLVTNVVTDTTLANALTTIGFDTVGTLANADVQDVRTRLVDAGLEVNSVGLDRALVNLRRTVGLFR
jgi:hypothetical protein